MATICAVSQVQPSSVRDSPPTAGSGQSGRASVQDAALQAALQVSGPPQHGGFSAMCKCRSTWRTLSDDSVAMFEVHRREHGRQPGHQVAHDVQLELRVVMFRACATCNDDGSRHLID